RIDCVRGDAKALPWPDGRFEAVLSNTIVHHIPDPAPALAEMARLVAPGGTLFVRDLARPATHAEVDALVVAYAGGESPAARGVLVIAHGFGEHGGCYGHVAETLGPALELDVVSPDQRGHGRSPGRRGLVRQYDELIDDVRSSLEWAARARPGLPLYLLGHSN